MLADVGVVVRGEAPGVGEETREPDPPTRAVELALRKARAVALRHPEAIVIGADQVVTDGVDIWGKPLDPADHLRRLQGMRGASHQLVTGWAVLHAGGEHIGHCTTTMYVRDDLTDDELRDYVATGEGSGCAGGYAAEQRGAFLFERVDGDWNNVIGLPLYPILGVLRGLGWRFGEGSR